MGLYNDMKIVGNVLVLSDYKEAMLSNGGQLSRVVFISTFYTSKFEFLQISHH